MNTFFVILIGQILTHRVFDGCHGFDEFFFCETGLDGACQSVRLIRIFDLRKLCLQLRIFCNLL